jgi:hypothetical protein
MKVAFIGFTDGTIEFVNESGVEISDKSQQLLKTTLDVIRPDPIVDLDKVHATAPETYETIYEEMKSVIEKSPDGLKPAKIFEGMSDTFTGGRKKSVRNAFLRSKLTYLSKKEEVVAEGGLYYVTE